MKTRAGLFTTTVCAFFSLNSCAQPALYNPNNDSWVKNANDRIERYRKAALVIRVIDKSGKPVNNAEVSVAQTSSTFVFGSAVSAKLLLQNTPDARKYQQIVKTHFNQVVLENDLKWESWRNKPGTNYDIQQTLKALSWLKTNNIKVRGHYLSWAPVKSYASSYKSIMTSLQYTNPKLYKSALIEHVKDILSKTKGFISEWDAINHIVTDNQKDQIINPSTNRKLLLNDYVGDDIYPTIFNIAQQEAPSIPLYVNEEILPYRTNEKVNNNYYNKINQLRSSGLNIGGIGFMGHFDGKKLPSINYMHSIFERFSGFNLPIKVTEFDIRFGEKNELYTQSAEELQIQKKFTEDFLRLAFSEPSVSGVVMWGFWEGRDWYPSAALYNKDWTIKPNGKAWENLVLHEWRTNTTGSTNTNGQLSVRGFLGKYTIKVKSGSGKEVKENINLDKRGNNITIKLL